MRKNKVPRYRLNDSTATKLGCTINKSKRYRLSKKQEVKLVSLTPVNKIKRLFWDIETSPNVVYAWRIGWNITIQPQDILKERSVISICYKWEGDSEVHTLTWDKNQCDKKMLNKFVKVLHQADESVAHNGKRFDEKWVRTRCIFHGIKTFPKYKSLDTLLKAKQGFNFNSNRLDYIAQFLGVGAKYKHSGFDMWKKIIEHNDPEAMAEMIKYNKIDVIVLEDVFHALKHYISPETHVGVTTGNLKYSCPTCGSEHVYLEKNDVTAKGTIQRFMGCNHCDANFHINNSAYKLFVEISKV